MTYKSMVAERYTDERGNVWFISPDGSKTLVKSELSAEEKQTIANQINAQTAKIVAGEREARQQRIDNNLEYIKNHMKP
ncbi:hypothetical protein [Prevotella sp.]